MTELEQIIKRSRDDKLNILKSAMFTLLLREFFTAAEPFKHIAVYDRLKECISILSNQEYEQWRDNITGSRKKERTGKMAKKRMFSLDVVDTDRFLDMPATTQALYFHLGMRADDDGFVSSPKRISNYVGCNEDDIKLLIAKGFIIAFESGVIVITDWKVNNSIRNDRYNRTKYIEELNMLDCENGVYTITDNVGIPNGNQMTYQRDTQVRLGKVCIDKYSIDNNIDSNNNIDNNKESKSKRFTPPAVEEVQKYCNERNNGISAETFIDFYTSKDWMMGKNKMKDWKAAVRTWERRNRQQEVAPAQPEETPELTEEQQELYRQVAMEQVNRMWGDE